MTVDAKEGVDALDIGTNKWNVSGRKEGRWSGRSSNTSTISSASSGQSSVDVRVPRSRKSFATKQRMKEFSIDQLRFSKLNGKLYGREKEIQMIKEELSKICAAATTRRTSIDKMMR